MQLQKKSKAKQAFLFALLAGVVMLLPFVILDGGYFIYYGDFNVQQIPFYKLAHEAVRSGDVFWSWYTDLGANFFGSYSFYLLFSPFFWLTLPFPTSWLPALMAPLLVLKTACAALTSFLYLRRFVRDEQYALIGCMLYAFSGWMDFNIFFNHFHEVAVFFPLLLLGLEMLLVDGKKGCFAVAVTINACVNYWFFVGEAVFVLLYVLIRMTDKSWNPSFRKFCSVALEAILGGICAVGVVLPSVLAILGNPRTGADSLINGWNLWVYWQEERLPAILQSLLFPPELPAHPNFFPDHGAKWASLSGWLPLFSVTGVLAYFFRRRDDWVKKMLALSLLFALVPVLNSLFVLFNGSYYARWFYMPILLMAMATARELEDSNPALGNNAQAPFARAIKWTAILLIGYTVMCGLSPRYDDDGVLQFGLAENLNQMWVYAAIAMMCLAAVAVLVLHFRASKRFVALTLSAVLTASVGFNLYYIANGKNAPDRCAWIVEHAIDQWEQIDLPDDGSFSRVDVYDSLDNIAMYWHLPTIQAFHSIVPVSIMEFYPEVGVTRDVASRPDAKYYALRPLLSVRWLFIEEDEENQEPMPGYSYICNQNGYAVYENDNYLPMGFSYDYFATQDQLDSVSEERRSNLMLRAVVLDEEAQQTYADLLTPLPDEQLAPLNEIAMEEDVDNRRMYTTDSFTTDNRGFTATTSFDESRLVFFSVPWDSGWSATLTTEDGTETELEITKANIGFMAVRVPAGNVTLRFTYTTPGLKIGIPVSLCGLVLLAVYWYRTRGSRKKAAASSPAQHVSAQEASAIRDALASGQPVHMTEAQFLALYGDPQQRKAKLEQALREAAALRKEHKQKNTSEASDEDSK